ncbi:zinc-binding protein [Seiridium cupressi]
MPSAPSLPKTMRAAVCEAPGPVDVLKIQNIDRPSPEDGQVLVKVLGFVDSDLQAEMFTRQGHSPGVVFPRIIGIECIGTIVDYPENSTKSSRYPIGTRVATCMGGMGRQIQGSYAEYTCVTETNVRPIPPTNLPISVLTSLPEMLQTTWGSLVQGLDFKAGESLLIRGATSSIGLCAIQMARRMGATRIGATTRSKGREQMLLDAGADEVFIDSGEIADQVKNSNKKGFNKVLELVGATTTRDSLKCVVPKGTVCMAGITGGSWDWDKFSLFEDLPNRARLCVYGGGPDDFLMMPWEALIQDIEAGGLRIPVKAFKFDEIQKVHEILEQGGGGAKMVVVVDE